MTWFPVGPEAVTAEWLSRVLDADVRRIRLEQIGIGVGIMGRLYRAHLQGTGAPASVVLKFPTLDPVARTAICEDLEFYLREVRFYQEIGLANTLPPARPYFAAFDDVTNDFVLVLEDLGHLRLADQTARCQRADAELVVDAIARHHAEWWESPRFATLSWLKTFTTPPFPDVVATNFAKGWQRFLDLVGAQLAADVRGFGERFPSLAPWLVAELARPPCTFLHGDLRLDQLFFAVGPGDAPVTALDWQITSKGRGAYDLGYFLSQSMDTELRRTCERELLERYRERLAERGVSYPATELERDYRNPIAWCFSYAVIAAGRVDVANDRQLQLLQAMTDRSVAAMEDHRALTVGLGDR